MKLKKLASLALAGALTLGLLPALSAPALAADGDTSYTLTIPSTLTVANSGWNALEGGISAKGTLESGKKLVVTPTSENSWNLVANKGEQTESKVGYNLAKETGTYSAAAEAPTWEFTELTADGTSQTAGIIVDDYSTKPAGTYQDTVTFTASVVSAAKKLTLTGQYTIMNDFMPEQVTKSLEIEYTDNDTWKDIAERYDEVSLLGNPLAPEGKAVMFWGDDGCQLKSNESTYIYNLVSINDKVSAYSSYFLES